MRTIWTVLGDVRPCLATTDAAYRRLCDTELVSNVLLPALCRTNRQHILHCQFRGPGTLATNNAAWVMPSVMGVARQRRIDPPPLGIHVGGVCRCIAKEQVRRVNASGVVAAVTDQHPARDDPEVQEPRNAMRSLGLAVVAETAVALAGDAA